MGGEAYAITRNYAPPGFHPDLSYGLISHLKNNRFPRLPSRAVAFVARYNVISHRHGDRIDKTQSPRAAVNYVTGNRISDGVVSSWYPDLPSGGWQRQIWD
jgi:hypothetical protein